MFVNRPITRLLKKIRIKVVETVFVYPSPFVLVESCVAVILDDRITFSKGGKSIQSYTLVQISIKQSTMQGDISMVGKVYILTGYTDIRKSIDAFIN